MRWLNPDDILLPVLAIAFWVFMAIAAGVYIGNIPKPRASAASADCTKWLAKAAQYANAGLDTNPELSSAYSLLAIANGCNR